MYSKQFGDAIATMMVVGVVCTIIVVLCIVGLIGWGLYELIW